MRFIALLKKEFRESLPVILLVSLLLAGICGFALHLSHIKAPLGIDDYQRHGQDIKPNYAVSVWSLYHRYYLDFLGLYLLMGSLILGVGLGIVHFWFPLFTRTWSFLLHRSVRRETVLWAKLLIGLLFLPLCLGVIWTITYHWSLKIRISPFPLGSHLWGQGMLLILTGWLAYVATGLSAMDTGKWYTTRFLGFGFVAVIVPCMLFQWSMIQSLLFLLVGLVVLVVQLQSHFGRRAF